MNSMPLVSAKIGELWLPSQEMKLTEFWLLLLVLSPVTVQLQMSPEIAVIR